MAKNSLANGSHQGDPNNKNQIIEQLILDSQKHSQDQLALSFIQEYFSRVPFQELSCKPSTVWAKIGLEIFETIKFRPLDQDIISFTFSGDGEFAETHLLAINPDQPFLVDSMIQALKKHGLVPNHFIHPVMKICRTTNGVLTGVLPLRPKNTEDSESCYFESIIWCNFSGHITEDMQRIIREDLTRSFNDIALAVTGWVPMKEKLQHCIEELENSPIPNVLKGKVPETTDFLKWLQNHHFTFLGYCEYEFVGPHAGKGERPAQYQNELGILKNKDIAEYHSLFQGITLNDEILRDILKPSLLMFNNTTRCSTVHRSVPMDTISIKKFDSNGHVIGMHQFVGLFTSRAYSASIRNIPLLREKMHKVLKSLSLSPDWHDGKLAITILESLPTDELLQASTEYLVEICQGVLQLHQPVGAYLRLDRFKRFYSCLIFIDRDRYGADLEEGISELLSSTLGGKIIQHYVHIGELSHARLHYTVTVPPSGKIFEDSRLLESQITELTLTWEDQLKRNLLKSKNLHVKLGSREEQYVHTFSKSYQESHTPDQALGDVEVMEDMVISGKLWTTALEESPGDPLHTTLKLYRRAEPVPLGNILPILGNLGMNVTKEIPYRVHSPEGSPLWIQEFSVELKEPITISRDLAQTLINQTLEQVWGGRLENDRLLALTIKSGLNARETTILRAYCHYLRQLQSPFSQGIIKEVLSRYSEISKTLITLFHARFDPETQRTDISELMTSLNEALDKITNSDEDRILRRILGFILATTRTNAYLNKDYISFKFQCSLIDEMPSPRPMFEIFVYSKKFEAVHLRGGKVARGGIRWSDRREDFRTEILDLMKAQMVKNSVIVPVGAKGGFVLKNEIPLEGDAFREEGIRCYKDMMRGLLDITDNLKEGILVPPHNVVCHDEEDPYLVVAADKGTATFSDFANGISGEYNFWLSDAFASGGSAGYDHKKLGITARGAWESVKQHFFDLNIDIDQTSVTVIGVGDMAGDVFGNGMLLNDKMLLIGAFNHRHIFLDPTPNPTLSFNERKRMFELPRSSWEDYDRSTISKGGGIYDRSSKSIPLSPEVKTLLGIEAGALSPNDLIQRLLKHSVDLLWFGGIGTFVKSALEGNGDVGDRANDALRINGKELRARAVGEGANLGMTQRARVEYSATGGRINRDSVDNSAGVDCSDHEVNIKILLNAEVRKNKLTIEDRNVLLSSMSQEVSQLVLYNNISQNFALTLAEHQGPMILDSQRRLVNILEKRGKLDRNQEALPDDGALMERQKNNKGLYRPEQCVLLAHGKIALYEQIIKTSVLEEKCLIPDLMTYFPTALQKRYPSEILAHPLHQEIIATSLTNEIANRFGSHFVFDVAERAGSTPIDVVRMYLVVREVFGVDVLWKSLENIKGTVSAESLVNLTLGTLRMIKRSIYWFLRYHAQDAIDDLINTYCFSKTLKEGQKIEDLLPQVLDKEGLIAFNARESSYKAQGLPDTLAKRVTALRWLILLPEVTRLSGRLNRPLVEIIPMYLTIGNDYGFNWLREWCEKLTPLNPYHKIALSSLIEDLYILQGDLTYKVLKEQGTLEDWERNHPLQIQHFQSSFQGIKSAGTPDYVMLTVATRDLKQLLR